MAERKVSGSTAVGATDTIPKFDAKTITLRQLAELYDKVKGRKTPTVSNVVKLFQEIADQEGSALKIFERLEGESILKTNLDAAAAFEDVNIAKGIQSDAQTKDLKSPMKDIRLVAQLLKHPSGGLKPTDTYSNGEIIFDSIPAANNTGAGKDHNLNIFGRAEPPKSSGASIAVNPDPRLHAQLFQEIDKLGDADNGKLRAVADALLFNLQTGLRPNAAGLLRADGKVYNPEYKSIYISSDTVGAKSNPVNIPLNDIANAILQNRLQDGSNNGVVFYEGGKKVGNAPLEAGLYFFVKPNGIPVDSGDMTNLLKKLPPIKNLFYDIKNQKDIHGFGSMETDTKQGKTGASLIRNIHASIAINHLGLDPARVAYLQGRSIKGVAINDVGELFTYTAHYPGYIANNSPDMRNANRIAQFFATSARNAGFEIEDLVLEPEQYITKEHPIYKEFNRQFDELKAKGFSVDDALDNVEINNQQAIKDLENMGFTIEYDDTSKVDKRVMLEDKLPPNIDVDSSGQAVMTDQSEINLPRIKSPKGLGGATMATLAGKDIDAEQAGGFLAQSAAEEVAEFGVSKALTPLIGASKANPVALATTIAMQPSTGAGPKQLMFEQMTDDQRRKFLSMSASDKEAFIANQSGEQKEYVMPFIPQPQTDNELVE